MTVPLLYHHQQHQQGQEEEEDQSHHCASSPQPPTFSSTTVSNNNKQPKPKPCNLGTKELHIAPMLDVSTIDFRFFIRLFTKRAILWTEMVVAETLAYNSTNDNGALDDHLAFDQDYHYNNNYDTDNNDLKGEEREEMSEIEKITQHPIICQIGGNIPSQATLATRLILEQYKYDGIDLNAECPSNKVATKRQFGAALMKDSDVAVDMLHAMISTAKTSSSSSSLIKGGGETSNIIPADVSIKTRIAIDENDSFSYLHSYISKLHTKTNCRRFFMHARKVYTSGLLNPAQNRCVPPLNYTRVYDLCIAFPGCDFWVNGGVASLEEARRIAFGEGVEFDEDGVGYYYLRKDEEEEEKREHEYYSKKKHGCIPCNSCSQLHGSCKAPPSPISPPNLKGVMVGRMARDDPCSLANIDSYFYGCKEGNPSKSRREVLEKYASYLERVYPKRCCDDGKDITVGREKHWRRRRKEEMMRSCVVCQDIYGPNTELKQRNDDEKKSERNGLVRQDSNNTTTTTASPSPQQIHQSQSLKRHKRHAQKNPNTKIVSRIIDQALKPTLGILYNQKGNGKFKRRIHELSRCTKVRNCGPGYILRKAMECVEDEVWDEEF